MNAASTRQVSFSRCPPSFSTGSTTTGARWRPYSTRVLPLIQWEPTTKGNVHVLNDTADAYRFFDATPHAEFLYECVERTIETHLLRRLPSCAATMEFVLRWQTSSICRTERSISCFVFFGRMAVRFPGAPETTNSPN